MEKIGKLRALYSFFALYCENPRISTMKLHKLYSPYKSKAATFNLVEEAFQKEIFVGPFLYCNRGLSVTLFRDTRSPLKLLKECKKDPKVTHAIALCGDFTFLSLSKGASELSFSDAVRPSFPAKMKVDDFLNIIELKKGPLPSDLYPHGWDELDWSIYDLTRSEKFSFSWAGRTLNISWEVVKRRYEKVLNSCKVIMAFFPEGRKRYDPILFTFKTKYELGIKELLGHLDRSSYLYKFNDTILLRFFADEYDRACEIFQEMEDMGMIQNLTASIPIRYYKPDRF